MLSNIERMLFLQNVSFFQNLRLDQLRMLARICEELVVNEGDYVINEGESGDSLFVVVEGHVSIKSKNNEFGPDAVLATMTTGDVLGEISLFDRGLRSADALADTPLLLLVVHRDALNNALAEDPGIALDMLHVMAERLRQNNRTMQEMMAHLNMERRKSLDEI